MKDQEKQSMLRDNQPVSPGHMDKIGSSIPTHGDVTIVMTTWHHILSINIQGPQYQFYFGLTKSFLVWCLFQFDLLQGIDN